MKAGKSKAKPGIKLLADEPSSFSKNGYQAGADSGRQPDNQTAGV